MRGHHASPAVCAHQAPSWETVEKTAGTHLIGGSNNKNESCMEAKCINLDARCACAECGRHERAIQGNEWEYPSCLGSLHFFLFSSNRQHKKCVCLRPVL